MARYTGLATGFETRDRYPPVGRVERSAARRTKTEDRPGRGLIKVGGDRVRWEVLSYYAKLPD